jgi:hypothetical protein
LGTRVFLEYAVLLFPLLARVKSGAGAWFSGTDAPCLLDSSSYKDRGRRPADSTVCTSWSVVGARSAKLDYGCTLEGALGLTPPSTEKARLNQPAVLAGRICTGRLLSS